MVKIYIKNKYPKQIILLFLFSIYKIVDSMDICKSLNISIGIVMKNTEMLKFVPDHLKLKKCVST